MRGLTGGIPAGSKSLQIALDISSLGRFASLASATIDGCNALASRNARYASVVMTQLGDTGRPARAMRANEAPLPPTSGRVADTSSSAKTSEPLAAGSPGESGSGCGSSQDALTGLNQRIDRRLQFVSIVHRPFLHVYTRCAPGVGSHADAFFSGGEATAWGGASFAVGLAAAPGFSAATVFPG